MAFDLARENALFIPILVAAGAVSGAVASLILKCESESAGGGIPSAVAAVRGILTLRPVRNFAATFTSSMLTYLSGIPLGTEGPCVQLGCDVGCAASSIMGKHTSPFKRYAMTGGACAGFAAATGAPITAVIFAIEEAHKKFRPAVIVTSTVSVAFAIVSHNLLCRLTGHGVSLFPGINILPVTVPDLKLSLIVGAVCGLCAVFFTVFHTFTGKLMKKKLTDVPLAVKLPVVFALCVGVGCLSANFTGTGHHLTEELLTHAAPFLPLVVILLVRWLLLIIANNAGVTGGTFIPNLTFGAVIGMLCASALCKLGFIGTDLIPLTVALGMCAYLGAVSKTPLMAIFFGIEALGGFRVFPSIVLACIIAYFVMHAFNVKEFVDIAIEAKAEKYAHSEEAEEYFAVLTVPKSSLAYGMCARDLLLPYGCSITSVEKGKTKKIHVTCVTGDKDRVELELSELFGTEIKLENTEKEEKHHGTEKQSNI